MLSALLLAWLVLLAATSALWALTVVLQSVGRLLRSAAASNALGDRGRQIAEPTASRS